MTKSIRSEMHGKSLPRDSASQIKRERHCCPAASSRYSTTVWLGRNPTCSRRAPSIHTGGDIFKLLRGAKKSFRDPPERITVKYLERFPEFVQFRYAISKEKEEPSATSVSESTGQTPEEALEAAYQRLRKDVAAELLVRVKKASPLFFERLVVELLLKMGYGGSRSEAGEAIGSSGDEGIDGIINEDRLGLDVIYLQAKRWEGECRTTRNS
jgi:restriction endonuclease Mrr